MSDMIRILAIAMIIIMALSQTEGQTPGLHKDQENSEIRQMAMKYGPIIFQEVDRGTRMLRQKPRGTEDFITGVDFDGDLKGNNNWENQPLYPLLPVIYHSVLETSTHYFISYSIYHPRDWNRYPLGHRAKPYSQHENDMENIQVVIAKNGNQKGVLVLLSQAHLNSDFAAVRNSGIRIRKKVRFSSKPVVLFNDKGRISPAGTHVGIFIERKGHGIYSLGNDKKVRYREKNGKLTEIIKKRDGSRKIIWEKFPIVQYVPWPGQPRQPKIILTTGMKQKIEYNVPYALESAYDKFWAKFEQGVPYKNGKKWKLCGDGKLFDQQFHYKDPLFEFNMVPRNFDSDMLSGPNKTDAGISPFSIGISINPLRSSEKRCPGLFSFNPASGYEKFFNIPGRWSKKYIYNPYLISPLNRLRTED